MEYIFLTLIVLLLIHLYFRYKPTIHLTDDGDILIFYWDYIIVGRERRKIRDYKRICNIYK
jgi:hypothetical protein